jgi:hypothetical protein
MMIFVSMHFPFPPVPAHCVQNYVTGQHWKIKSKKKYKLLTTVVRLAPQSKYFWILVTARRGRKIPMLSLRHMLEMMNMGSQTHHHSSSQKRLKLGNGKTHHESYGDFLERIRNVCQMSSGAISNAYYRE